MPFRPQAGSGGIVFHVLNRSARRLRLFDGPDDYREFIRCLVRTRERIPVRILSYSVMPNHFHLVVWPQQDGELSAFMHLMTSTHAKRWHLSHGSVGSGAVYQARFKALPVQNDHHFLTVCRYVERNALRAELVHQAEEWPWCSLAGPVEGAAQVPLDEWPVPRPRDWTTLVNDIQFASELEAIRRAVRRGLPLGDSQWAAQTARRLAQEAKPLGRPRKVGG